MARLEDRYELIRKLAAGGMGEVFLAKTIGAGGFEKQVVVKVLHKHLGVKKELFDLFLQEARLVGQMSHPNIVQVFDAGENDGRPWLVMEFVDGANLLNMRRRSEARGRKVPLGVVCRIMSQVFGGLSHAHQLVGKDGQKLGLVHRDLSPDNIMVDSSGVAKVTDFGIAKVKDSDVTTAPGWTRGKFMYMSPEQISGAGQLTDKADLFVAGVVMYELITGKHPFFGSDGTFAALKLATAQFNPMNSVRAEVPEALELFIRRALAQKPEDRFQSARAMKQALEQLLKTQPESSQEDVAEYMAWLKDDSGKTWLDLGTPIESVDLSLSTVAEAPNQPTITAQDSRTNLAAQTLHESQQSVPLLPKKSGFRWMPVVIAATLTSAAAIALVVYEMRKTDSTQLGTEMRRTPDLASIESEQMVEVRIEPHETVDAGVQPNELAHRPDLENAVRSDEQIKPSEPKPNAKDAAGIQKPVAKVGEVAFRVQPWANVYVDGKHLGQTPFEAVKLSIGTHRVRLTNSEMAVDRIETVVVKPGKQTFGYKL
jgi:eukaryotic-like serine/threonine-protein kinase